MPLITPDEACSREGSPSAACIVKEQQEIARREMSVNTCIRLFHDQEVMQSACISSCRSYTTGDGQECAFSFSRSLREVAVEQPGAAGVVWFVILMSALVCTACWAVMRARRKVRA